jgi:uncharacterized protein YwgA
MSIQVAAATVAQVVADAGGQVVGRTRLQKLAYLLSAAGLEGAFSFAYKHYGPYSEELAQSAKAAQLLGLLTDEERSAQWGGTYSTYQTSQPANEQAPKARRDIARIAIEADAVELELAATAVFLSREEGIADPWAETARRKPEKAEGGRLKRAKVLYKQLQAVETPQPLPAI